MAMSNVADFSLLAVLAPNAVPRRVTCRNGVLSCTCTPGRDKGRCAHINHVRKIIAAGGHQHIGAAEQVNLEAA